MDDSDRVRDVGLVLKIDSYRAFGNGDPQRGRAELQHEGAKIPGLRTPMGKLSHALELLHQFHHVHSGSHALSRKNVSACHVPYPIEGSLKVCHSTLDTRGMFCLVERAE
jgi:hypothetical protein